MRKTLLLMGLAGAVAAAPSLASAQPLFPSSCWGHRVAGTVLGGVGGGAIGAAIAAGVSVTPWAWAAAGVGALLGHAIGVHSCRNHWRQAYDGYYEGPPPPYPYVHYHYYYPAYHSGYYAARYDDYRRAPVHHPHHARHAYAGEYATQYARSPRG